MIHTILLVAAFVLALIEAVFGSPPSWPRPPHFGWLAVALVLLWLILAG